VISYVVVFKNGLICCLSHLDAVQKIFHPHDKGNWLGVTVNILPAEIYFFHFVKLTKRFIETCQAFEQSKNVDFT